MSTLYRHKAQETSVEVLNNFHVLEPHTRLRLRNVQALLTLSYVLPTRERTFPPWKSRPPHRCRPILPVGHPVSNMSQNFGSQCFLSVLESS
jgi:hypothetical protein